MFRRFLHFYWRFSRGLTMGVRAAVIDGHGCVLLVRHGYTEGWHLPGGGVETGETFGDALARELLEEGNVTLTGEPELHGIFQNSLVTRRDHVAVYVVRHFQWAGPAKPGYEIAESGFFAAGDLPGATTPGTRRRLDEVLNGAPPASAW